MAALGSAAALTAALTACGAGDTTGVTESSQPGAASTAASTASNDADVRFAQDMIGHHRGAIEMADLAADRSEDPQVLDLAERIRAAQAPEIDTMTSLLEKWGADVPAEGSMSDMSMPGMMSADQMTALAEAQGTTFDRLFLELMTEHHQGAVEMSQTEISDGEDPQAVELARTIEADQTAEIAEMQQMLSSL